MVVSFGYILFRLAFHLTMFLAKKDYYLIGLLILIYLLLAR